MSTPICYIWSNEVYYVAHTGQAKTLSEAYLANRAQYTATTFDPTSTFSKLLSLMLVAGSITVFIGSIRKQGDVFNAGAIVMVAAFVGIFGKSAFLEVKRYCLDRAASKIETKIGQIFRQSRAGFVEIQRPTNFTRINQNIDWVLVFKNATENLPLLALADVP